MKFTPLTVLDIIPETPAAYTIRFAAPEGRQDYLPGQYLTLRTDVAGESLRRAYSLSSCPVTDKFLSVTIKAVADGRMSNYLKTHLKPGDVLDAYPPMGSFNAHLDPEHHKLYLLIGGGSGITPLMSILKSVLATEPDSKVVLLYGNRDETSIIFRDELIQLQERFPERLDVRHVLSQPTEAWIGQRGRLEGELAHDLIQETLAQNSLDYECFVCGPQGLMDAAIHTLQYLHVPSEFVHREYYSAPLPAFDEVDEDLIARDVTLLLDGIKHTLHVTPDSTILQAAIDADLDPPYSCQEGVCTTCRAKLYTGMVQMYVRDGLSDEEMEANYILTCQSVPLSDDVVIEFA